MAEQAQAQLLEQVVQHHFVQSAAAVAKASTGQRTPVFFLNVEDVKYGLNMVESYGNGTLAGPLKSTSADERKVLYETFPSHPSLRARLEAAEEGGYAADRPSHIQQGLRNRSRGP